MTPGELRLVWFPFSRSEIRSRRLWTAEERDFEGTVLGCVEPSVLDEVRRHVQGMLDI